jgi:radical SAM protein with 4Fe4S-binding SPASM domain
MVRNKFTELIRWLGKRYVYNSYYRSKLTAAHFPPEVFIENTNMCNARCVMCPRDKHTRPQGIMSMTLYKKIISEIEKNKNAVGRVHLHNYGEPLLDKDLALKIRMAKEAGVRQVYFVTNASLLTEDKAAAYIAAGLDEFKISFYGTDPETYNNTMVGLDFETTMSNVKTFFRVRKDLNARHPRLLVQYLPQPHNRGLTEEFVSMFENMIDKTLGDSISIFNLHNFGGGRSYSVMSSSVCTICNYPWRAMVILHDGRVVPCCLDYNGEQVFGDANVNSIADIWNGAVYKQTRKAFKSLNYAKYPVCLKCEHIR